MLHPWIGKQCFPQRRLQVSAALAWSSLVRALSRALGARERVTVVLSEQLFVDWDITDSGRHEDCHLTENDCTLAQVTILLVEVDLFVLLFVVWLLRHVS